MDVAPERWPKSRFWNLSCDLWGAILGRYRDTDSVARRKKGGSPRDIAANWQKMDECTRPSLLDSSVWTGKAYRLCLGAFEEEPRGNPSGLATTIYRGPQRIRIYISNCDAEPELARPLQSGGDHIHPYRTKWSFPRHRLLHILCRLARCTRLRQP